MFGIEWKLVTSNFLWIVDFVKLNLIKMGNYESHFKKQLDYNFMESLLLLSVVNIHPHAKFMPLFIYFPMLYKIPINSQVPYITFLHFFFQIES